MQVAARLQLVELHLSTRSPKKLIYVELLQMGVKQNLAEIDALYMGYTEQGKDVLITVEAKTDDDIYDGQIVAQVLALRAMKSLKSVPIDFIIPLALKSIRSTGIFVLEFQSVNWSDPDPQELKVAGQSMFELKPPLRNL